ncbi:putative toxin-antitoxin system toxin component, PIN family [Candidatus Omnitrophota bacterium]
MQEIKAVIDTNVLVSILKGSTNLSTIYSAFKDNRFTLVISTEILKELAIVLYRPNLDIDPRDIKELFRLIKARALRIKLPAPFIKVCRDPRDNFILEVAVVSESDFIVSGDEDLLILKSFSGIPIVSPSRFIHALNKL